MLSSPVDIAMIVGVALIIFGPKKMPELGKALGQGIANFKRGLHDAQDEMKTAMNVDEPTAKVEQTPGKEPVTDSSVQPAIVSKASPKDDKPVSS